MSRSLLTWIAAGVLTFTVVTTAGCGGGGGSNNDAPDTTADPTLSQLLVTAASTGALTLPFSIASNVTSFQLVAVGSGVLLTLTDVRGPGQEALFTSSEVSDATSAQRSVNVWGYPTLVEPLRAGQYSATYSLTADRSVPAGTQVRFYLVTRSTALHERPIVRVNVALVGPLVGSPDLKSSIQKATDKMRSILDNAGIKADVQYFDFAGPRKIPDPRRGDALYETISNGTRPFAVNLVFGAEVQGTTGSDDLRFSVPSSVPGSALPSARSAMALSVNQITGGDGIFDSDDRGTTQLGDSETRVAGEEMARMVGFYLGVQSPVKFSGSQPASTDSLSDTASCVSRVECENNKQPRQNFVFPRVYFIPGRSNSFYPRDSATDQQRALLARSVLAR